MNSCGLQTAGLARFSADQKNLTRSNRTGACRRPDDGGSENGSGRISQSRDATAHPEPSPIDPLDGSASIRQKSLGRRVIAEIAKTLIPRDKALRQTSRHGIPLTPPVWPESFWRCHPRTLPAGTSVTHAAAETIAGADSKKRSRLNATRACRSPGGLSSLQPFVPLGKFRGNRHRLIESPGGSSRTTNRGEPT